MNEDFLDMLEALVEEAVDFMVVGAYALAAHDIPRATGDVDIWIRPTPDNAERAWRALENFGAPLDALHVSMTDCNARKWSSNWDCRRRIDLMTSITGVDFETAARLASTARSTRWRYRSSAEQRCYRTSAQPEDSRTWLTLNASSEMMTDGPGIPTSAGCPRT